MSPSGEGLRTYQNLMLLATTGAAEPGNEFSRSYWHGWRNGAVDFGRREIDQAQQQLAREIVGCHMRVH